MGSSPVTGPTPNKGYEAQGIQRLGVVIKQLTEIFSMMGPGSEEGKDVLKALNMLAKHVPPGAVSPAGEKNSIEAMMMKAQQNAGQMNALKQPGPPTAGGPPGAAPPPAMPKAA
jgi:hypothetical protein